MSTSGEQADRKTWLLQKLEDMQPNGTCAYCANRRPKRVCGSTQSPHSGTEVDLTDKCEFYSYNPAQLDYVRALFLDTYGERAGIDIHDTVRAFRKAIEAGLPADDEVNARFCIAKHLAFWIGTKDAEPQKWARLPEAKETVRELESALVLDRAGGFGFFEDPKHRFVLLQLDLLYAVEGGLLSIEQGQGEIISDAAAIEYWEKKLLHCDYLSTSPLILTLLQAGYSYSRLGNTQAAIKCFRLAVDAAPVDLRDGKQDEFERQKEARICLDRLTVEVKQAHPIASSPNPSQLSPPRSGSKSTKVALACAVVAICCFGFWRLARMPQQPNSSLPPLEMGTVATCEKVTKWRQFVPKSQFHPGDPICVYAEAHNVNHSGRIDVTFTVAFKSSDNALLLTQTNRFTYRGKDPSCEYHWSTLRLPASASSGIYIAEAAAHDNLTNQTGTSSAQFTVTGNTALAGLPTPQMRSSDTRRLLPVDEASTDQAFDEFRRRLLSAIE